MDTDITGYAICISTQDKPNFKTIFATSKTATLLAQLNLHGYITSPAPYNYVAKNDLMFEALLATSAK